jgi:hypothetical protein
MRNAFSRDRAQNRGPWLPPGTTHGTWGATWVPPSLTLQPPEEVTKQDGLGSTKGERNHLC